MNMLEKIKRLFTHKKQEKASFSDFFYNASPKEMQKLMENVAKKANQDQRAVLDKYERR